MKAKISSQVHKERINLHDEIPLKTPLVIYTEPSGYCNLRCNFCPQINEDNNIKKSIMSLDLFKKSIDDLINFEKQIELLRVCGFGEPLMNKNIIEMLKYAKESNFIKRIELISNGTLLNDELIDNISKYTDRIIISIEGLSSKDYFNVCNRKVNYENLVENIKKLYYSREDCILHLKIHHKSVDTKRKEDLFLNTFGNFCDEIYIEKLIKLWPEFDLDASENFRYGNLSVIERQVCSQMFKGFQIIADGRVIPCCADWQAINVIGDLNKDSMKDIWNGTLLKSLQIEHLKGNKNKIIPCKDCTMNDYCDYDNIDNYAKKCLMRIENE